MLQYCCKLQAPCLESWYIFVSLKWNHNFYTDEKVKGRFILWSVWETPRSTHWAESYFISSTLETFHQIELVWPGLELCPFFNFILKKVSDKKKSLNHFDYGEVSDLHLDMWVFRAHIWCGYMTARVSNTAYCEPSGSVWHPFTVNRYPEGPWHKDPVPTGINQHVSFSE